MVEKDKEVKNSSSLNKSSSADFVRVEGNVGGLSFGFFCSRKYFAFLSRSRFLTILHAYEFTGLPYVEIFFVGKIPYESDIEGNQLTLEPLYIGGTTQEVFEHFKEEKPQGDSSINFAWIIQGILGHSEYPHPEHFSYLWKHGIRAIVSLEKRPDESLIKDYGFEYLEVQVKDFTAPSLPQLDRINEFIDSMAKAEKPVLIHCLAAGRSGTAIVSYLIHGGSSFDDALKQVRDRVPNAVETESQIQTLKNYEDLIRKPIHKKTEVVKESQLVKRNLSDPWYLQKDTVESLLKEQLALSDSGSVRITNRIRSKFDSILRSKLSKVKVKTPLVELEIDVKEKSEKEKIAYSNLLELIDRLVQKNELFNLEEKIKERSLKKGIYVYFKGKATIKEFKSNQ